MVPSNRSMARARPRSTASPRPDPSGDRNALQIVAPNSWMGECDRLIGPFTCRRSAETFANAMVDFGHYECLSQRVVLHEGAYFVQACGIGEATVLSS